MTLLLSEPPLLVQRGLIIRCGGNVGDALMCQQLSYWLDRATKTHGGYDWVYKTYEEWGEELGVSPKTARGSLDRLRSLGFVVSMQNPDDSRDRTLWWRVDRAAVESGGPSAPSGTSADVPGTGAAPEGSSSTGASEGPTTTTETTAGDAGAISLLPAEPKRKPITFKGKTVERDAAATAEALLAVFNDATGSKLSAFSSTGKQTDHLTRIVSAVLEHREVTMEQWERGIRSMVERPPGWMEDQRWTPGHVFGGRAVTHTLSRAAASQTPGKRVASGEQADEQSWSRRDF